MTILPAVNATLNATSCVLLCSAFVFIKKGKWRAHGYAMVSATLVSVAFLTCYLAYHYMYGERSTRASHAPHWLRYPSESTRCRLRRWLGSEPARRWLRPRQKHSVWSRPLR